MRRRVVIIIATAAGIISGCMVGPNYERPKVAVEGKFGETGTNIVTNEPTANWWKTFNDPELDKLITEALRTNYNLQIATERIREARLQRNITAADLFPNIDADAGYARARGSKNVVLPLGGSSGSGSGSGSSGGTGTSKRASTKLSSSVGTSSQNDSAFDNQLSPFGKGGLPGVETDLYQAGFDATWEVDVFGGTRRRVEAATAQVQSSIEARRNLAVTLLAEVARNYLEFRGTQRRLAIAKENLGAQREIVELTQSRQKSGLATDLDVAQAATQAATTSATIPPLEFDVKRLIHALSILLAREPNALASELEMTNRPFATAPKVPVGLPSQLLERRPDIRQAERQIAAATSDIGVATADLFPKFALVGTAGLDSTTAEHLFDWESRYFLISPTVSWRIFDAGRIKSNIKLQKATRDETVLQYRSAILTALQEVEDAIVAYSTEQTRRDELSEALAQSRDTVALARQQYEHGLATFLNVLDAERTVFSAQDALAQSTQAVSTDVVAIYKALGGGWGKE
ncbi:MAG TPA: efflux transporter outer membrane subunit [Verrucomicrobiae bacterium]|jgi:NodT family efflux transporter outer membrane factor (OMF) lipoprotein|nr:efflux transporter outer membrane subunit [Verrucomicrobiae bacterium]